MHNKEIERLKLETEEKMKKTISEYKNFMESNGYSVNVSGTAIDNKIPVKIYFKGNDKDLPRYQTQGSSGLDIRALIDEPMVLDHLDRKLVPTGIYVDLPANYEIQLRPRSGMAFKRGLTLINCLGTIDDDYVKEIFVPIVNLSGKKQIIEPNERIAQMVLSKVDKCEWVICNDKEDFDSKDRVGGFGSTGNK